MEDRLHLKEVVAMRAIRRIEVERSQIRADGERRSDLGIQSVGQLLRPFHHGELARNDVRGSVRAPHSPTRWVGMAEIAVLLVLRCVPRSRVRRARSHE